MFLFGLASMYLSIQVAHDMYAGPVGYVSLLYNQMQQHLIVEAAEVHSEHRICAAKNWVTPRPSWRKPSRKYREHVHIFFSAQPICIDMLKLRHARHVGRETSHDTKIMDCGTLRSPKYSGYYFKSSANSSKHLSI